MLAFNMEETVDVGKDLNRDLCSLKAVLESEDDKSSEDEKCSYSEKQPLAHSFTLLDKLKLCLEKNLIAQRDMSLLLSIARAALDANNRNQRRVDQLDKTYFRVPRSSVANYLKGWRTSKSSTPYFIDHKLKAPPRNIETIDLTRVPDFYSHTDWLHPFETNKLKAGVRQKNLEILSNPIREEMAQSNVTIQQLKDLQQRIRLLQDLDNKTLLKFSPDLDWNALAYEQFGGERSGDSCRLRYMNCDRPGLTKSPWTREEEKKLLKVVKENGMRNWVKVAEELNGRRSAIQCMSHYQKALNPKLLNKLWTPEEEKKLQEGVIIYGKCWGLVSDYIGTRTGIQCSNRYHILGKITENHNSGRWKKEEDKRLIEAVEIYGDTGKIWGNIGEHVRTRTSIQCRERWRTVLTGSTLLRPWTEQEKTKLMEYTRSQLESGEVMHWTKISSEMNRRDDDCRRQWLKLSCPEDKVRYKTLLAKTRELVKSKRNTTTSTKHHILAHYPTIQAKDIEDDMLSEQTKHDLDEYHEKLVKDQAQEPPKKKRRRKKKSKTVPDSGSSPNDVTTTSQQTIVALNIPIIISSSAHLSNSYISGHVPNQLQPPSTTSIAVSGMGPYSLPITASTLCSTNTGVIPTCTCTSISSSSTGPSTGSLRHSRPSSAPPTTIVVSLPHCSPSIVPIPPTSSLHHTPSSHSAPLSSSSCTNIGGTYYTMAVHQPTSVLPSSTFTPPRQFVRENPPHPNYPPVQWDITHMRPTGYNTHPGNTSYHPPSGHYYPQDNPYYAPAMYSSSSAGYWYTPPIYGSRGYPHHGTGGYPHHGRGPVTMTGSTTSSTINTGTAVPVTVPVTSTRNNMCNRMPMGREQLAGIPPDGYAAMMGGSCPSTSTSIVTSTRNSMSNRRVRREQPAADTSRPPSYPSTAATCMQGFIRPASTIPPSCVPSVIIPIYPVFDHFSNFYHSPSSLTSSGTNSRPSAVVTAGTSMTGTAITGTSSTAITGTTITGTSASTAITGTSASIPITGTAQSTATTGTTITGTLSITGTSVSTTVTGTAACTTCTLTSTATTGTTITGTAITGTVITGTSTSTTITGTVPSTATTGTASSPTVTSNTEVPSTTTITTTSNT